VFILTAMSHRLSLLEKRHTVTVNTDMFFCWSYCSRNLADHSSNTNTLCMWAISNFLVFNSYCP
jgi:hypothetical protein